MSRYDAYDPFARIYDRHWGFFATSVYPILDHLVLERLSPGCAVLDLCCGTGQLAAELSRQGYVTTGLDGSESMIEIARENAPDVEFVVQDARNIDLLRRFSAVFSTFDSLNHVMSLGELEQVFQSVFTLLEDGGYFAFDLNMEEGYRARWHGSFAYVEEDYVCAGRSSHDANEKTGRFDVTLFEPKGSGWERTDYSLTQRWYEEKRDPGAVAEGRVRRAAVFRGERTHRRGRAVRGQDVLRRKEAVVKYPGDAAEAVPGEVNRRDRTQPRRWLGRVVRWGVTAVLLAVLPFVLLVRGGVFAYQQWGLGAWFSVAVSAAATALLLAFYAWAASRRLGAGKRLRKFAIRVAALAAAAFVLYSLLVVAGGNVKSEEVRAEYLGLHPLLRMAVSVFVLADADAVITDAARTPEFYARVGLPRNESSLHFRQDDGFAHALDLRTLNRPEWRNLAAELAFRAMGFHTLRHAGTADHLHVSLR